MKLPGCLLLLLLSIFGLVMRSEAVHVQELSLEKRIAASDLIATGIALTTPNEWENPRELYATVRIESAIKGKAPLTIQVLVISEAAELSPNCCQAGSKYLFFLKRLDGNKYRSVNAGYGIYKLPN